MAYLKNKTGDGVLYLGNVKWNNEYKHCMLFDSEADRDTFLREHLTKKSDSVVFINPNGYADIKGKIENAERLNYAFFVNDSDISETKYCCFVTNFEYLAPDTTRLYLQLDVFQQFYYQTKFFKSFVERAIVKKSTDTVGAWTQNEPFTVKLEYEHVIKDILDGQLWEPQWVLHTASYFNPTTKEYEYSGIADHNTFGEYGFYIDNIAQMNQYLATYGRKTLDKIFEDMDIEVDWADLIAQILGGGVAAGGQEAIAIDFGTSLGELQDHRNELIGLYAIPKWVRPANSTQANNARVMQSESVTVSKNTLANGYGGASGDGIKNKKLLTSVCRAYLLVNRNGFREAFKPELFSSDNITVNLFGIPMSTSGYQYSISNYANYNKSYGEIPYSSERRVGYDQNTGLNKVLNTVGAVSGIVQSGAQIAGNIASGNVAGAALGLPNLINSGVNAVDMLGTQGASFGNNGDLLRITGGFAQLRLYELNPSVNECRAIDDFFSTYGYTINEISDFTNPNSPVYIKSRQRWNYIKTANLNCNCYCPSDYENRFKQLFNDGVTVWHSYADFCDYEKENN